MKISIKANFDEVVQLESNYGNISSNYGCNSQFFTKYGEPFYVTAGEIHFNRVPWEEWEKELLKMKTSGINVITTTILWNHHELRHGVFDFTGDNDINSFLFLCKELNLPCIIKLGPWCKDSTMLNGMPKRLKNPHRLKKNEYLNEIRIFWMYLFEQIKDFMDGESIIALEFDYGDKNEFADLLKLKRIAQDIGYKAPFFMASISENNPPSKEFLSACRVNFPTEGKDIFKATNNFCIMKNRLGGCIGEDLIQSKKHKFEMFDGLPYICDEVAVGFAQTFKNRTIVDELDGYGMAFAKLASGCNFMNYHIYHGGRTPIKLANNPDYVNEKLDRYSLIDFDCQAPINRYGGSRDHDDQLRLMHTFLHNFDIDFATKQAFFPHWLQRSPKDVSYPKCSVRVDENLSGYFFVTSYERGVEHEEYKHIRILLSTDGKSITLPKINIKPNSMFFYPFNFKVDGLHFDYILAQPIAKVESVHETTLYFKQCNGLKPILSYGGNEIEIPFDNDGYLISNGEQRIRFIVLSDEMAKKFHLIDGKVFYARGTVYSSNTAVFCETIDGSLIGDRQRFISKKIDVSFMLELNPIEKMKMPLEKFMGNVGTKKYYELKVDKEFLQKLEDAKLVFDFSGTSLQVYCNDTLIVDYFNIDGRFVMSLGAYQKYIINSDRLVIVTASPSKIAGNLVHTEIPFNNKENALKINSCLAVYTLRMKLH